MKKIMMSMIRFYQRAVSPCLGSQCRFVPSCSEYARETIGKNGAWYGALDSLKRILKCHPFHPGGFDPVE